MSAPRVLVPVSALCLLFACGGEEAPPGLPEDPACDAAERTVENEGWNHVPLGSAVSYASNPPASGPHYPLWARYQRHEAAVPRPYWVHNLEHGAIVLLHRPDAPADVVEGLVALFEALPADPACGHPRALLTADAELTTPVAAAAADHVLEAGCVTPEVWQAFVEARRGQGPENVCFDGSYPP